MVITSFLLCRRQVDRNCLSCHHQSSSFLRSRTFRRRRFGAGHLGASHFGAGLFGAITLILSVNFGPGSRTLPLGYYPPDITPRTLRPRTLPPPDIIFKTWNNQYKYNIFISFIPLLVEHFHQFYPASWSIFSSVLSRFMVNIIINFIPLLAYKF